MTARHNIVLAHDGHEWLQKACATFRDLTAEAIRSHGRCLIALSGGTTPTTLYRGLTSSEWRHDIEWEKLVFLFGDERCVPPDHPDSNYGLAARELFGPLNLPGPQIFRMNGSHPNPVHAAHDYEQTIRTLTGCVAPAIPTLDLVLLGLGDDGHTASLFPGTALLEKQSQLVAVSQSPKGIPTRLTLTLGVINRATVVLFLVAGASKAPVVRAVFEPQSDYDRALPAARVRPVKGRVLWVIDAAAGRELARSDRSGS